MLKLKLFGKLFFYAVLAIAVVEAFSYLAYFYPILNTIGFFLILLVALIFSLWKLEYGLFLILAELIIGSKGYLFSYEFSEISISIRLGLYLVVLGVWLIKLIKNKNIKFPLLGAYSLLFVFLAWGILRGVLNHNSFDNIFFDFNGWLFFGLVFAFVEALNSWEKAQKAFQVILAAALAMILKTVFILFIFSHQIDFLLNSLYRWVRLTGVGEITKMPNNFYRVFFQSHIFAIIIFFFLIALIINVKKKEFAKRDYYLYWLVGLLSALVIFVSYSRSLWLGGLAGLLALYYGIFFVLKLSMKRVFVVSTGLLFSFAAVYLLTLAIIKFPWPSPSQFTGGLIEERTTDVTEEAGATSRFKLLTPLADKIKENVIIGSGFGTTITYQTDDPRFLSTHPDGKYTAYAFEWGYLDIWVKLGLAGLLVYLFLIYKIFRRGWIIFARFRENSIIQAIILGSLIGLFAIVIINFTTPYLNHPLGIGYLLLVTAILNMLEKNPSEINQLNEITSSLKNSESNKQQ